MKKMLYILLPILLISLISVGQTLDKVEIKMADAFRENGKIYVVAGVVIIIFSLTIIYLFLLEKKLSKIERQLK